MAGAADKSNFAFHELQQKLDRASFQPYSAVHPESTLKPRRDRGAGGGSRRESGPAEPAGPDRVGAESGDERQSAARIATHALPRSSPPGSALPTNTFSQFSKLIGRITDRFNQLLPRLQPDL